MIILDTIVFCRKSWTMKCDLHIPEGSLTIVTGPNGAGKSTLLNIIAGFEKPESGSVIIQGKNMTDAEPSERPVSMIFQENNLFPHLDIKTNIQLGCSLSRHLSQKDHLQVLQALKCTNLIDKQECFPEQLSGGEQQRAAIARCLVRNHPVLLLDEPFSALDPSARMNMLKQIKNLREEKKMTVVLVSHDTKEIRKISDIILFLKNGIIEKKETSGKPGNAYRQYRHQG